jgi:hypothetical protein
MVNVSLAAHGAPVLCSVIMTVPHERAQHNKASSTKIGRHFLMSRMSWSSCNGTSASSVNNAT